MDEDEEDRRRFDMMSGHLRTIAEAMLTEHFGERCPDFEEECVCCKRWKALDALTASPYCD